MPTENNHHISNKQFFNYSKKRKNHDRERLKINRRSLRTNRCYRNFNECVQSKIEFHKLKNFSSEVCTGTTNTTTTKRVTELKEDIETIKKIIKEAQENNKKLVIKSVIDIQLHDNN